MYINGTTIEYSFEQLIILHFIFTFIIVNLNNFRYNFELAEYKVSSLQRGHQCNDQGQAPYLELMCIQVYSILITVSKLGQVVACCSEDLVKVAFVLGTGQSGSKGLLSGKAKEAITENPQKRKFSPPLEKPSDPVQSAGPGTGFNLN